MKCITYFLIILSGLGLVSARFSHAASLNERTIEQTIPSRVFETPEKTIVTLVIENDSLGGGTDNNYTSGVRFNFMNVNATFPPLAHKIDKLIPTFEINNTSSIHYSFGQNLYTPRDITQSQVSNNDRPWAAFLYGSLGMVTLTDNHTDEVEATFGVVGPAALGKPAQHFIHKHLTNSPIPKGWSHQLKNEPGIILAWQRGWPMFVNGRIKNNFWSLKPYAGAAIGNIRTHGDVGFTIRLSPNDSKWQDTPIRVAPAMPGTGIYEIPQNKWSWSLFAGFEARAVVRDIFLDGNSFANSHSVNKKPIVSDITSGIATTYRNTRISYTVVYRTKEFYLQDRPEVFGALSLGIRF